MSIVQVFIGVNVNELCAKMEYPRKKVHILSHAIKLNFNFFYQASLQIIYNCSRVHVDNLFYWCICSIVYVVVVTQGLM